IGMPVYNGAAYIREALEALLSQTFKNFELIISDNASTDDTQRVCEDYAKRDKRIRYIRQETNQGALANFKYVLDQATAELFIWTAHDDLWAPDFLSDAVSLLKNKNVDFVFPTFELQSIKYGLTKRIPPGIFKFIESEDRKKRILSFIALHYLSHSANIVYSVFRTEFIRSAWVKQNIGNDGLLGAVIVSQGIGAMSNSKFSKRYPTIWPGIFLSVLHLIMGWLKRKNTSDEGRNAIELARSKLLSFFPEYEYEVTAIFQEYHVGWHQHDYKVCNIDKLI
ncbi:MAG: glycosyltransferase family 2 protein, partial [Nitrosomonadales bacterium]|nr:glycosyltransferase family 2 protein [Nitrosomonadales bacterium]